MRLRAGLLLRAGSESGSPFVFSTIVAAASRASVSSPQRDATAQTFSGV